MDDPSTASPGVSRPGGSIPAAYPRSYALSGKIMLSSIIVLFVVVVLMLCLHIYARYLLLRRLRRRRGSSGRRRHILVFNSDHIRSAPRQGLDPAILSSIPVFTHEPGGKGESGGGPPLECAVCLCEFEEEEKGRMLPACKHSFHVECIDMWFGSNSTCPLCRSVVRAADHGGARLQALSPEPPVRRGGGDAAGSTRPSSGLDTCEEVRIEVVRVDEEVKSPAAARRVLSFKRILTGDLRGDLERGERSGPSTPQPRR